MPLRAWDCTGTPSTGSAVSPQAPGRCPRHRLRR
jgi:hypothetical protein